MAELEKSDVVARVGKGGKIPSDISEEDRARLEKTLREQVISSILWTDRNRGFSASDSGQ